MPRRTVLTAVVVLALVTSVTAAAVASPPTPRNFVAQLSGDQEAEPVDTSARGVATFQLDRSGDALHFRLIVANIHDVLAAHIHLEASNGPVVVWLHTPAGQPELLEGRQGGPIATGTITSADLVGPLAGADLDALLAQILAGEAWVNVHTVEHPGGEIAGPINRPRGHIG